MVFCLSFKSVYMHILSAWRAMAGWHRFTAVVNFNSKLLQHLQDINILMVTRRRGREGRVVGGWGVRLRCTSSVYEAESKWLSKRVRGCLCVWEGKRERETVVMIDARLPPLCSSEWLQQKAQNNIPDSPLCCFLSPCISARRRGLRSQLCRGYAVTVLASEAEYWLPSTS